MKTEIDFLRGAKAGREKVKRLEKELKESEIRANAIVKKMEELVVAKQMGSVTSGSMDLADSAKLTVTKKTQ